MKLTDSAVQKIKELATEMEKTNFNLRIAAKAGGCAGLLYHMDFEETKTPTDTVIPYDGFDVLVDSKSYSYLSECTLDYENTLHRQGFKFDNKNAERSCGCGKSFC